MAATINTESAPACETARRRLLSIKGDPFLIATWERAFFLHFVVEPEVLRAEVPKPFELELHEGAACVSLVALTMSRFRPCRRASPAGLFGRITQQRFLNFRTYVRCADEPGALFLWGWLSRPFQMKLPSNLFALPYSFAAADYEHRVEWNVFAGTVSGGVGLGRFAFRAAIPPAAALQPCLAGSLEEFALERYTGYYCRGTQGRLFRAWHPPWQQAPIQPMIQDASLIFNWFPWFSEAKFSAANFSPGFSEVWLGRPHRLGKCHPAPKQARPVLSAFYKMP